MAASRQIHRLNALRVAREVKPGYYADGGGLYLQISSSGSRSWIFRFTLAGRAREMGLGPLSAISLAEARAEAARCRKLLADGIDPIEEREAARAQAKLAEPDGLTFKQCAAQYIESHKGGWKNKKHAQQWENTLATTYAYPIIGDADVRDIETPMIVRVLQPIWSKKPQTASRVRGRIEAILDAAKVLGKRAGENPARWRGHLDKVLPKRDKVRRVKHHPALPYSQMPEFMQQLASRQAPAARVLHLLILTCVRTSEALLARPEEFDRSGLDKVLRLTTSPSILGPALVCRWSTRIRAQNGRDRESKTNDSGATLTRSPPSCRRLPVMTGRRRPRRDGHASNIRSSARPVIRASRHLVISE